MSKTDDNNKWPNEWKVWPNEWKVVKGTKESMSVQNAKGEQVKLPHEAWHMVKGKPALRDGWYRVQTSALKNGDFILPENIKHLPKEEWHVVQLKKKG